jgi:hypothetical protein
VLLTYTAGMAAMSLSPVPAGIGVVEGALVIGLTTAGAAAPAVLAAVLIYRLITIGEVAVVGWLVLAANRTRPSPSQRGQRGRATAIVEPNFYLTTTFAVFTAQCPHSSALDTDGAAVKKRPLPSRPSVTYDVWLANDHSTPP